MEEQTHDSKTLGCPQFEEILAMEENRVQEIENPVQETMEIENPSLKNPKTLEEITQDQGEGREIEVPKTLGKSLEGEIEGALVPKTLEKSLEGGIEDADIDEILAKSWEIEDAHVRETLEKSSGGELEETSLETNPGESSNGDVDEPEPVDRITLDDIAECMGLEKLLNDGKDDEVVLCGEDLDGGSSNRNEFIGPVNECASRGCLCRHHNEDGDKLDPRRPFTGQYGSSMSPHHYGYQPYGASKYFDRRRYRGFQGSSNVETYCMDDCGGRGPNRDPYGMNRHAFCQRRYGCRCRDCEEREVEFYPFPVRKWEDPMPEPEPEPCPVGAGLYNMGNTCFLNAIIQCFTHTVPLVQGLLSLKHDSSSHDKDEYCVLCAVHDQIEQAIVYSGRVMSPTNLVDNLNHISSFFRRYQQEDAHEFLQCLLGKLDDNWCKYETNSKGSLPSSDDSLVRQVFGGRLVSQVRCSKCGHNSDTYESFIDLSLGIDDGNDLEGALRSFTKVESIADTEKFVCESCKEQVAVEKQLLLDQAPAVVALQLKRFKSDGEKIDKKVEYPLELDLEPYSKGAKDINEELKYELFGVVVHVGISSTSGHYFCYICTAPDAWYRFDDSKVKRVSEEIALNQDVYILFYARKGTPWFSSLIDEWKASFEQKMNNESPKSVLVETDLPSTSKHDFDSCELSEHNNAAVRCISSEPSSGETTAGVDAKDNAAENTSSPDPRGLRHDEAKVDVNIRDAQFATPANETETEAPTCLRFVDDSMVENIKDETCSLTGLKNIVDDEAKNDVLIPSTPPRSPSPDIYADEENAEVEVKYKIPIDHLKFEEKKSSSGKKAVVNAKHDLKRKEAAKYICKTMPSSRRQHFMAAMMGGSRSDSSLNKKRRKHASFMHSRQSPKKRVKLSPKRVLRPVTA